MEKIKIGRIVNAVGLRGEVRVYNYAEKRERYETLDRILAGDVPYPIEGVRYQQHMVILKLAGVSDRNAAEALKGTDVYITEADLAALPPDTFYLRDLIGLTVTDAAQGTVLGTLRDVLQNGAQDVYVVALEQGGEVLIPAVTQFIRSVDLAEGCIRVSLIPGMLDT